MRRERVEPGPGSLHRCFRTGRGRRERRAAAVGVLLTICATLVLGYGSPNYNDMNTGEISFDLEYPNKIHTWAVGKALALLRDDGYPGMADFAQAYLLPILLGNAWNDHWGDREVMTEGVLLDYFKPDPSEHNNGYGNPDGDIFSGIDHSTDEFAACPFWFVENAGDHAELRLQAARRATWGRWGEDARDRLAGYVAAIRDPFSGFYFTHDPIHGTTTYDVSTLPWNASGGLPALVGDLVANRVDTKVLFPAQSNLWLSTIHVPRPEELHDRGDWLGAGETRLRGWMGPDGGGKQVYLCFAGENGLGIVYWVPPNSLEHAFFLLGWAMHLVQDSTLPMHATDDEWDMFNAFRHNDFEDVWGAMLSRSLSAPNGGPVLKDVLPASTLDQFRSLYVFPPQRTPWFSVDLAVDPAPMFCRRWYEEDLAPLLRAGEGVAHGYVRISAEMAQVHLPYMETTQDEPEDEDAPYSLGFLLAWCTDLTVKTSAGLLHHFLTDVVQLREGEVWDGHGGPMTSTAYPYTLVGDLTVPAGKTLTVGPGVTILQREGQRIRANGTLRVQGGGTPVRLQPIDGSGQGVRITRDLVLRNGGTLQLGRGPDR